MGLGGKCTNGRNSASLDWCYVHPDSGCDDLKEYHGQHMSYLACKANNTTTATTIEKPKPGERFEFLKPYFNPLRTSLPFHTNTLG